MHYGPHVAYPDRHIGWRGSHHQCRGGEGSGNASDRDNGPTHDNNRIVHPRVRNNSLAHTDSRDDKHRNPAANGQLADRDHLNGEGHL